MSKHTTYTFSDRLGPELFLRGIIGKEKASRVAKISTEIAGIPVVVSEKADGVMLVNTDLLSPSFRTLSHAAMDVGDSFAMLHLSLREAKPVLELLLKPYRKLRRLRSHKWRHVRKREKILRNMEKRTKP